MRGAVQSMGWATLALAFAGCVLPAYEVDESLGGGAGGAAGARGNLPELPDPPDGCGAPKGGPAMVPVHGGYCIDATEVTWTQYMQWASKAMLNHIAFREGQPSECSWNETAFPDPGAGCEEPVSLEADKLPVVCVNYCDALAYCQAMGKDLCGHIEGGSVPFGKQTDPGVSQWMNACSSGGSNEYPYPGPYDAAACYTQSGSTQPVQQRSRCQSENTLYDGVYDLSGNVAEWEKACDADNGQGDSCLIRGGSYQDGAESVTCESHRVVVRQTTSDLIGFRCCWTPPG